MTSVWGKRILFAKGSESFRPDRDRRPRFGRRGPASAPLCVLRGHQPRRWSLRCRVRSSADSVHPRDAASARSFCTMWRRSWRALTTAAGAAAPATVNATERHPRTSDGDYPDEQCLAPNITLLETGRSNLRSCCATFNTQISVPLAILMTKKSPESARRHFLLYRMARTDQMSSNPR